MVELLDVRRKRSHGDLATRSSSPSAFAVYQGLIPWAWIEASTKGAVLLFAAAEIEGYSSRAGISPALSGLLGGMGGGVAQAYATMGRSQSALWPSKCSADLAACYRCLHLHEDGRNHEEQARG